MLKQLRLSAQIKELKRQKEELLKKRSGFEKREADLTAALSEAATKEDIDLIDGQITELEKEIGEAGADEESIKDLDRQIAATEKELEEIGRPAPTPQSTENNERKEFNHMKTRGIMGSLTPETRSALLNDGEVKEFLTRTREFIKEKRSIKGAELSIPVTLLDILKENVALYSKIYSHVNVTQANGTTRRVIAGAVPEGIWTEMVGTINELDLDFSLIETDGYKVAGLFIIDNSTYKDSDASLLSTILEYLSAAIGQAIDKAVVYGTGNKMPLGFVTRLAQSAQPSDWSAKAPKWTNLSESHIKKLDLSAKSGEEFFAELLTALMAANPKKNGSNDGMFWVMNRKTHLDIITRTIKFNAAAALVATNNGTMPVIGGDIIELEFMADYDIAGGYGAVYSLIEREGYSVEPSTEVKFIDDQTVFKGIARYDGKPAYAEGFVLVNYTNTTPTTVTTFAADSANGDRVALSALTIGTETLLPCPFDKDVLNYHLTVTAHKKKITATALDPQATVVIHNGSTTVNSGSDATFTAGENKLTITVTNGNAAERVYTVIVNDQTSGS